MKAGGVNQRLRQALEGHSHHKIGDVTGHSAESVRRYLAGESPSAEFLGRVCVAFGINADWALTGEGRAKIDEQTEAALLDASGPQLMVALAEALVRIERRLDALEESARRIEAAENGARRTPDR